MRISYCIDLEYDKDDFVYDKEKAHTEITYKGDNDYPSTVCYFSGTEDIDMPWPEVIKKLIVVTERAYTYEFTAEKLHKMIDDLKGK